VAHCEFIDKLQTSLQQDQQYMDLLNQVQQDPDSHQLFQVKRGILFFKKGPIYLPNLLGNGLC